MQPLRRNFGKYCGERIHVSELISALAAEGKRYGWETDWLPCDDGERLLALRRHTTKPLRRVYVSAGIHGDEPAGPFAILRLLRENHWPDNVDVWLCPLLNAPGFARNTREDDLGADLNRDYRHRRTSRVKAHVGWLESQPSFDCGLHLHEDWESAGFYLYELNPRQRPTCGARVIEMVEKVCPIERSEVVDGWQATGGILRPNVRPESRQDWPEAFFMVQEKTDLSYTLEGPSDFPLPVRVNALTVAVRAILREVCS